MGNVGNIEKVMVFGILLIIICILGIAVWGNNEPSDVDTTAQAKQQYDLKGDVPVPEDDDKSLRPTPIDSREYVEPIDPDDLDDEPLTPPLTPLEDVSANGDPPRVVDGQRDELPRTYTVVKGDTFEAISKKLYGSAAYIDELMKANEDVVPSRMKIGLVINVPQIDTDRYSTPDRALEVVLNQERVLDTNATYTVRPGDTLYGISKTVFGSSRRWREIFRANKSQLNEPGDLQPGMVLTLPN